MPTDVRIDQNENFFNIFAQDRCIVVDVVVVVVVFVVLVVIVIVVVV